MGKKKKDVQEPVTVSGFIKRVDRTQLVVRPGLGAEEGNPDEITVDFDKKLRKKTLKTLQQMKASGVPVYGVKQDDDKWFFVCSIKVRITAVVDQLGESRRHLLIPALPIPAYLLESNPHFEAILDEVQLAIAENRLVWIAAIQFTLVNGLHQGYWEVLGIIDRVEPVEPCVRPVEAQYDESSHQEISVRRAQEIFSLIRKQATDLNDIESGGIPFSFLDAGCVTRAHEMCRLIRLEGVHPLKLWAFDTFNRPNLKFQTINHPRCQLEWSFHNAPIVRTYEGHYVIDPSVADYAIPVDDWLRLFSSDNMRLYCTSDQVYEMSSDHIGLVSDPYYEKTQSDLETLRICFRLLVDRFGKPPYADCISP